MSEESATFSAKKAIQSLKANENFELQASAGLADTWHRFEPEHIAAIQAAWFAGRPLLIRGEPGLGKSQLAHALAQSLNWNFLVHVVHSRTEPDDLLFTVDHVARLAKAQLLQAGQGEIAHIAHEHFIVPGPLWWAYAPKEAKAFYQSKNNDYQSDYAPNLDKPFVLLVDEIDKAQRDLPNSLLEILNNQSFRVPFHHKPINVSAPSAPFVVITSNDERPLPAAFLRRCVVLNMTLQSGEEGVQQLVDIAHAHQQTLKNLSPELIAEAADLVINHRKKMAEGEYKPGTSEFLDMLRILNDHDAYPTDDSRREFLNTISPFLMNK